MYIGDCGNHRIRKLTVSTNIISTIAGTGGTSSSIGDGFVATSASLYLPYGVAVDSSGITKFHDNANYYIYNIYF